MEHWFQNIFFVNLCPDANWQFRYFYGLVVNNFHIALHKEFVAINLRNGTSEVLEWWYLKFERKNNNTNIPWFLPLHYVKKGTYQDSQTNP